MVVHPVVLLARFGVSKVSGYQETGRGQWEEGPSMSTAMYVDVGCFAMCGKQNQTLNFVIFSSPLCWFGAQQAPNIDQP